MNGTWCRRVEVEVNKQEVETEKVEDEEQLDPGLMENGRTQEMDCMVETLKVFEFGSWQEATAS